MPEITSFGVLGVIGCVVPGKLELNYYALKPSFRANDNIPLYFSGLLVGAIISKNIASFLEENDLFIVSDEDDD